MASISFQPAEKINDENKPLPGTPSTPSPHKIQDLGRTSSQKKARKIFDSLRSMKSRGKLSSDIEYDGVQSVGADSPIRRRNSTWDLFGTIRTRKSSEFGAPENERPLITTPLKSQLEITDASVLIPKRRKSLVNMLGSISNKVSPRRIANSRENPPSEEILPEYCEEYVFANKLAKDLVDLKLDDLNCTNASTSDEEPKLPNELLDRANTLEADHNKIIENFKLRQLDDLLNDGDGYDANSWTSRSRTLQNEESLEQLSNQTPTTDSDRSRTPDSYLCSIIKSFDDYNSEPKISNGKEAIISPSPSPGKLQPTKPIDFLKDLSPDVIPGCKSSSRNQYIDTASSIMYNTKELEPPGRTCPEKKRPIITIREVTSDSDFSFANEDPIPPSPPKWQDVANYRDSLRNSRAKLPGNNSPPYFEEVEPFLVNQTEERKYKCQSLQATFSNTEEPDQQPLLPDKSEERKCHRHGLIEPLFVDQTVEPKDQCQGLEPALANTEELYQHPLLPSQTEERKDHHQVTKPTPSKAKESDEQRIARSIKQTADKMTKNLHFSSFSKKTMEEFDDEPSKEKSYPSELEYKYSLSSDQNLDSFTKTVEDFCTKTQEETPYVTMIRKNIGSFKNTEFLAGPVYVKYPQSAAKWRHIQCFPTGSLALSEIRKKNEGEYSDTITYCPEKSCIYVHLWGELPKPERDLSVRVRYPETKTRWGRTQIYYNGDLALADMKQQDLGEFSEIRYDPSERCFNVYTWGDIIEEHNCSVRVDYPETKTRSARTQIYADKNLAVADIGKQSHGEFSEIRYNASERHFRAFTWGEVIDSPDTYIRVDFDEPEIERNVRVDYPKTTTRCARTQMYENEDLATAHIYRENNGEYSKFIYSSLERRFRVQAQPEVIESAYRAREPAWRPTLSPLGDRDEDEQDLPDFSDLEDDFQLVTTGSFRGSSPGIQSQEGVEVFNGDDNSGSNDMSLFVEAGTPRKTDNEFLAELFMGDRSDNPTPLLRGSKQILQYLDGLDGLDGRDSTSKILQTEDDLQSDRRTTTKAWAESSSTKNTPQTARSIADELFAKVSHSICNDDYPDNEATSLRIEVVEDENRKSSNPSIAQGFKFSNFADIFGEVENFGISISHEVSKDSKTGINPYVNENENIISDFDRDVVHRRERSNAICGENIRSPFFNEMLDSEEPPVAMPSDRSDESIFILPIDNIDLYEENAGCGDTKASTSCQVNGNIAAFSNDAGLISLIPDPVDQNPKPSYPTLRSYKIDTHLWSANLSKSEFEGETEQTGHGPGLWANTCTKFGNIPTASSVDNQPGLEISSISPSTTEKDKYSGINNSEPKGLSEEETKIKDAALLVETVSQGYIGDENCPLTVTRTNSRRIPTLVNIFHSRGMMSPSISPASTRPFLDRCSSPIQTTPSPKRGETQTPRIVTPSGKVYSPAKEEQEVSNPIQRVQTPGTSLSGYMNQHISGDETDSSEGFGEELEKMNVKKYDSRSSHGSISLDESGSD